MLLLGKGQKMHALEYEAEKHASKGHLRARQAEVGERSTQQQNNGKLVKQLIEEVCRRGFTCWKTTKVMRIS